MGIGGLTTVNTNGDKKMKIKDAKNVSISIDNEGMWYCFDGYSAFKEIEDEEFHEKRKEFLRAGEALREYVGYDEFID